MTDEIAIAREGAVLSAALARPQKKNAIAGAMYEAVIDVLERAEGDTGVGALVLSGKGGAFTAGNDIADLSRSRPAPPGRATRGIFQAYRCSPNRCRRDGARARARQRRAA